MLYDFFISCLDSCLLDEIDNQSASVEQASLRNQALPGITKNANGQKTCSGTHSHTHEPGGLGSRERAGAAGTPRRERSGLSLWVCWLPIWTQARGAGVESFTVALSLHQGFGQNPMFLLLDTNLPASVSSFSIWQVAQSSGKASLIPSVNPHWFSTLWLYLQTFINAPLPWLSPCSVLTLLLAGHQWPSGIKFIHVSGSYSPALSSPLLWNILFSSLEITLSCLFLLFVHWPSSASSSRQQNAPELSPASPPLCILSPKSCHPDSWLLKTMHILVSPKLNSLLLTSVLIHDLSICTVNPTWSSGARMALQSCSRSDI